MLDVVRPTAVNAHGSTVEFFDNGQLTLEIAHTRTLPIHAIVNQADATVGLGNLHEHFSAPRDDADEQRPWTTEAVDFIAEILRGEIEEETTYRGTRAIAVRISYRGRGRNEYSSEKRSS